jgi:hypothetical protein
VSFASILGGLAAPVADYFKRRMEIKAQDRQQERAIKQATVERQIELIKEGLHADMSWEMEFAKQAASSYKDEYTLIVVSIPAVLAFIPGMDVYVAHGFEALSKTPGWYQLMLVTLFFATVGIRYWRRNQSDT